VPRMYEASVCYNEITLLYVLVAVDELAHNIVDDKKLKESRRGAVLPFPGVWKTVKCE
jgi:hypothetical protein